MLADLDNGTDVMVIDTPHEAFMLEARSSGFRRRVDSPCVGRRAFDDCSLVDEAGENLFENSYGCERPYGGYISLDRDLQGGIGEGHGEHLEVE